MLEFILGRGGTGKTHACLSDMREAIEREPLGSALILLVPEHMTYQAERELASSVGRGHGFFRAHVLGFRRFARQVLMEVGGAALPRMTEVGRRLLLRKILVKRRDDLGFYARSAQQRGFSASLSDMIQELKDYRVKPDALREAANRMGAGKLSAKLNDLALISEEFASAMEGRQTDAEDMMEALAERIPRSSLVQGAEVYVDGFIFFNPQERAVLRSLMQTAANVHVTLPMDPAEDAPENRRPAGLFHRSWETLQTLRGMAGELGMAYRVRGLGMSVRFRHPGLLAVEQNLFRISPPVASEKGGVHIVEAANRRIEIEAAAADILRLCREEGYRYSEIGILVRDKEAYGELLPLVLEDRGIPFFEDSKRPAAHHPLAELLRSLLEMLPGWRYEAVFRCLRTGFFAITRDQLDQLENYVLEFGIRGEKRWTMEEPWPWRRRSLDDVSDQVSEAQQSRLDAVDMVRRQAAEPLAAFAAEARKAASVEERTAALYHFLERLGVPEQLEERARQDEARGRLAMAREHGQIWEDVMELFEQLVAVSGEERMDLRTYGALLGDGLDALEMSLIPPGLDDVAVASFDQNSLVNARAIYILGANEGMMPRRSAEQGLLSDADRLHLREAGLEISSGGQERAFAENFLLYRGFTEARDYLWVSYSLADTEGEGLAPSSLVQRIRRFLPGAEFIAIPLELLEPSERVVAQKTEDMEVDAPCSSLLQGAQQGLSRMAGLRLSDGRRAVSGLSSALRARRETGRMEGWWQDAYNWLLRQEDLRIPREIALRGLFARASDGDLPRELALKLFSRNGRMRGSVTRFERFRACPFQHFAQYGLRLEERRERRFQALDLGTLLHSVLREYGEELKAEGRRWGEVGDEERRAMVEKILEQLAPRLQNELLLSTAQYRHQLERIRILAERSIRRLAAFDAVSEFHPGLFERSFGTAGPGSMPPLSYKLKGARLEIVGQIDRVDFDEAGRYFLVMDYKTGQAFINLIEVYFGLKMQLLTYLLAARNLLAAGDGLLPAGMLYCFLRSPALSSDRRISVEEAQKRIENGLKMPGWVLAAPEVVRAIDPAQKFIKVQLNKDESISKTSRAYVKTMEEFEILLGYIDLLLADTGQRILSGSIEASPCRVGGAGARTPCGYCPYQVVCGFDPEISGFRWRDIPRLGDEEILDAMELAVSGKTGILPGEKSGQPVESKSRLSGKEDGNGVDRGAAESH